MGAREAAQATLDAIAAGQYDELPGLLTDDFTFDNGMGMVWSAHEWAGMLEIWQQAMPDINYNLHIVEVSGDTVRVESHIMGTHTGPMDLSAMGMGVIPATGMAVEGAPEMTEGVERDGKIAAIRAFPTEGSGFGGILAQLGIQPPQ